MTHTPADSRSVHTDALATLGTIIGDGEGRDAIHLAVENAVAAHMMLPGDHVGFEDDGRVGRRATKKIGIVDPFLPATGVAEGQHFWLVVYPRQITSLRHVWEHPAFPLSGETDGRPPALDRSASEKWMRAWAVKNMSEDYYGDGTLSEDRAYENAIHAGENLSVGPYEDARDAIDNEWWSHWEAITGKTGDREAYFSCSC